MITNPTHENRMLKFVTPLGDDVLLIRGFSCNERISSLYTISVSACVTPVNAPAVKAEDLIGKDAGIAMYTHDRQPRYFRGMIRRLVFAGRDADLYYYNLELVPWFWRLSQRTDCRIFQNKTVPEIVEKILGEFNCPAFELKLTREYTPWDYCVQYRESYFHFISRLLEQEGLFYFFQHEESQHKLVIADAPAAHTPCPINDQLRFAEGGRGDEAQEDIVHLWEGSQELRPGLFTMRDHNFQIPRSDLEVSEPSLVSLGDNQELEIFDYPGEYAQLFVEPNQRLGKIQPEGDRTIRRRMQAEEASQQRFTGASTAKSLAAGSTFQLTRHFQRDYEGKYVLTSVSHSATQSPSYTNDAPVENPYRNSFEAIPFATPFVPRRATAKPVMQGPQTAVVVGPAGEEIHTDVYGRVKVKFHWDRLAPGDETSSCWVRVSTMWAGNKWGMIHLPRIGQEVVVAFLEGDPDQPLVVGSVYNADQMPPYDLPANQTQSGIKSRSSKGGQASHFNEIRFEDKKDKEEIYVHAERKLKTVVEAAESRSVGASRTSTIHQDDKLTVEKGNYEIKVLEKDQTLTVSKGNQSISVQMGNIDSKAPMGKHSMQAKEVEITGTTKITLMCGASKIELTPAQITIMSPMVKINC